MDHLDSLPQWPSDQHVCVCVDFNRFDCDEAFVHYGWRYHARQGRTNYSTFYWIWTFSMDIMCKEVPLLTPGAGPCGLTGRMAPFLSVLLVNLRNNNEGHEWMGKMHESLFVCVSVPDIFGITQLRVSYILFAERQLFVILAFFFFLFHWYCTDVSACIQCICGIRVCDHDFSFLYALTERVCVRVCVFPHPFVCGATRFISTCLQNYRSMQELDLWKIIDTKIRCNLSSV